VLASIQLVPRIFRSRCNVLLEQRLWDFIVVNLPDLVVTYFLLQSQMRGRVRARYFVEGIGPFQVGVHHIEPNE